MLHTKDNSTKHIDNQNNHHTMYTIKRDNNGSYYYIPDNNGLYSIKQAEDIVQRKNSELAEYNASGITLY